MLFSFTPSLKDSLGKPEPYLGVFMADRKAGRNAALGS